MSLDASPGSHDRFNRWMRKYQSLWEWLCHWMCVNHLNQSHVLCVSWNQTTNRLQVRLESMNTWAWLADPECQFDEDECIMRSPLLATYTTVCCVHVCWYVEKFSTFWSRKFAHHDAHVSMLYHLDMKSWQSSPFYSSWKADEFNVERLMLEPLSNLLMQGINQTKQQPDQIADKKCDSTSTGDSS